MKSQKQVSDTPRAADRHLWQIQPIRDFAWIFLVLLFIWLGYEMRAITVPLLVAVLLAYLFAPVVSLLERRLRFPRSLSAATILAVGGVTVLLVGVLTVPLAVSQTMSFLDAVRKGKYDGAIDHVIDYAPDSIQPQIEQFVDRAQQWIGVSAGAVAAGSEPPAPSTEDSTPPASTAPAGADARAEATPRGGTAPKQAGTLDEARIRALVDRQIEERLSADASGGSAGTGGKLDWFGVLGSGARRVVTFALGVLQLGILVFLIPFYFFYFTIIWPKITSFGSGMILKDHREHTLRLVAEMDKAVSGFVRGRIVIAVILAVMYSVGWTIVGVPYAIPLGIIIGTFSLIPYLGGVGLPLSIGLMAADQFSLPAEQQMAWWGIILWPGLVYMICQFADDYCLTPLIAGKATNLDPVSIVVAILAGGTLAGLYGMLIAIPVAACIKILIQEVFMPRIRDWIDGRVDDPLPIDE
ncbi:MAG: AI-2E family transporter [Planctomycetota bacterium]|nr:AI-2E family transporter [Planctomycetota bacterium]